MDLGLRGKRALVTGASKGIGGATARLMAQEGCDVVLVARSAADLERLRGEIVDESGVNVAIAPCDLSQRGAAEDLAAQFGNIDILVNNAGAVPPGSLLSVDEDRWRAGWDLKVFGYINMSRAYYAIMKARGGGVIVNVLGIISRTYDPNYICVGTGNEALAFFTRSLGSRSHEDNIRVLGVNPGSVATERWLATRPEVVMAKERPASANPPRKLPFDRPGTPLELASTIAFLASPRSGYTSGTIIEVDGGFSAALGP
jgi:3-oxoacyl-[acyl-carrier protein] reductase